MRVSIVDEENDGTEVPLLPVIEPITKTQALKLFLTMYLPFSFSRIIGIGSDFAGGVMLSQLGSQYLAASGLITVYRNFATATGATSIYSAGSLSTIEIAHSRPQNVGKVLRASYVYAALFSVPAVTAVLLSGPLLKLCGQPENVADIVQDYFGPYAIGIPLMLMSAGSQQVAYALGHSHAVLAATILRRAIQVTLSYGLIFGRLNMPHLRAAGMGYASTVACCFEQAFFMLYFKFNRSFSPFELMKNDFTSIGPFIKGLVSKSLLLAILTCNEYLATFVGTILIGLKGENGLAASEIAVQYDSLVRSQFATAGQTSAILIGKMRNPKAGEAEQSPLNAQILGNIAMISSLSIPLIVIPLFSMAPTLLARPFISESGSNMDAVLDITKTLLIINGVGQIANAVKTVSGASLRGYSDYKYATQASIFTMSVVALGIGSLLEFAGGLGAEGMFLGYGIGLVMASMLFLNRWLKVSSDSEVSASCIPQCAFWGAGERRGSPAIETRERELTSEVEND